ncbi:MAG: histidine--tRNA ligase [Candidatus Hodarchaeales archaeon]
MELRVLKGTRDYLPETQIIRESIIRILRETFELYGFNPLETPILEFYEILASKYAGGAEILKETYHLKDQGNRELALRYDLTVPLSRVIGMNPHLKMPFKRYEIGKIFRDGPVTAIRVREFTQCDIDTVGTKNQIAEAEQIAMTVQIFERLGIDVIVEANNRKLLSGIINYAGVEERLVSSAILSIDKLKKIGTSEVKTELIEKGIDDPTVLDKLFGIMDIKGDWSEILSLIEEKISNKKFLEGIKELREFYSYLEAFGIAGKCKLLLSLARGLEIYTGTVFEVFIADGSFKSSLAAGGRYDRIIGKFLGNDTVIPAVGISFGLESISGVLLSRKPSIKKTVSELFIVPVTPAVLPNVLSLAQDFRKVGITTEVELTKVKMKKSLDRANTLGIPFVSVMGSREFEAGKVNLKNMLSGDQSLLSLDEAINRIKKNKNNIQ